MEYREIGTPKQHAEYLVDLFWSCVENGGMQLLMAKKCAELAVLFLLYIIFLFRIFTLEFLLCRK